MRVEAVIFDIGNVLTRWQPEAFYDRVIGEERRRALFDAVDLPGMNLRDRRRRAVSRHDLRLGRAAILIGRSRYAGGMTVGSSWPARASKGRLRCCAPCGPRGCRVSR